jgi:hypothetical protein
MTAGTLQITAPTDSDDVTLVVAQRTNRLHGYRILMHQEVSAALRAACRETVAAIDTRTPVTFAADIEYDPATQYLEVPAAFLTVAANPPASGDGSSAHRGNVTVETDPEAHTILRHASSQHQLRAPELGKRTFVFYAVVVGNDPDRRNAFVTHWNPHRIGLEGKILTAYGNQLREIRDPLLAFEHRFHMVLTREGIAVLNKAAFEVVFRDVKTMQERVPIWADHVGAALPLDDAGLGCLRQACARNMRLAAKARSLFESGTLKDRKVTANILADEMRRQGLDADRMVKRGILVIEEGDVPTILKLLDEGLWRGWLTDTPWEAGSKVKRQ